VTATERIRALEAELAELRLYLPMLTRLAVYEALNATSIPTRLTHRSEREVEFARPRDETLPAAVDALLV
jgi:hypothetical protein